MTEFAIGDVVRVHPVDDREPGMTVTRPRDADGEVCVTWSGGTGDEAWVRHHAFPSEALRLVRRAERPLVIPTGEPRWISEEEDAASPPSPRLRDEPAPEPAKKGKGMEDPSYLDELTKHVNRPEPRPDLSRENFVDRVIRNKPKTDPEP